MPDTSIKSLLIVMAAGLLAAVGLSEIIRFLTPWFGTPWIAAATLHSVIAILVACRWWNGHRGDATFVFGVEPNQLASFQKAGPSLIGPRAFYPAIAVGLGAVLLAVISALYGGRETSPIPSEQIAWVLWIPVVEEWAYRVGAGYYFRSRLGLMAGSYLSNILFSLMHSQPTIEHFASLQIGLPLGPLLLGAICELIYLKSGKVLPAILFHMICNATPAIFATIDIRWLSWLKVLYLGS